jgi:hypothetical protein
LLNFVLPTFVFTSYFIPLTSFFTFAVSRFTYLVVFRY